MSSHALYYHEDRTHLGLAKDKRENLAMKVRDQIRAGQEHGPRLRRFGARKDPPDGREAFILDQTARLYRQWIDELFPRWTIRRLAMLFEMSRSVRS
jgi:hypothetical protein